MSAQDNCESPSVTSSVAAHGVEHPILFSGPMVRAILEGRKTQTRRAMKPQPELRSVDFGIGPDRWQKVWMFDPGKQYSYRLSAGDARVIQHCPYGHPGERLWVRETWREVGSVQREDGKIGSRVNRETVIYCADGFEYDGPWRPSIFMPRRASRITLEIVGVRVERLGDISEEDAKAEGVSPGVCTHPDCYPGSCAASRYRPVFFEGWNKINAKRGYGWEKKPWVWVIEFRKV